MPRHPGSATLKPDGKGGFTVRLELTWPDGKVRQHKLTAPTKRALRELADAKIRARDAAAAPPSIQHATIGALIDAYLFERAHPAKFLHGIKVSGVKGYGERKRLCEVVRSHFGTDCLVRSLGTAELEAYKAARVAIQTAQKRPRKLATINHELEILRALLNFATQRGIIQASPFQSLKNFIKTSHDDKRERVPTFGEEKAMLAHCVQKGSIRRDYFRAVIIILADTGMRRGELTQLRWDWYDLSARTISLPKEATKTNRARVIPLTDRAITELEFLRGYKFKMRRVATDPALVFGGLIDFETIWRNVCADAGVTDLRLHDLRHCFVTRSIIVGVPLAAITAASGHVSDEWQRYANPAHDGVKSLLAPFGDQIEAEVKAFARAVLSGLRRALGYDLEDLLS